MSLSRIVLLPLLLAAALLAGCGGGGSLLPAVPAPPAGPLAPAAGAATFTVKWPDRAASPRLGSRLIPAASNSIVLIVKRGGTVIASQTLARPTVTLTLPNLPVGTLTVSAAAYPSSNGTGAVQASASAPLVITSGQATSLTLSLADTISSIRVTSASQSLPLGGTLALLATAYDLSGNVVLTGGSVTWTSSNTSVASVSSAGLVSGLAVGSALLTATDSESGVSGKFAAACATSAPYGGVAAAIPGTVQAEDYDLGGEGVAYHDTDVGNNGGAYRSDDVDIETCTDTGGGYDTGWNRLGEWQKHTVNVATAGTYTVGFRVASSYSGQMFHLENSAGTNLTGEVTCPNTMGPQNWQTVNATVTLPAGVQTIKLVIDSSYANFNYMAFQVASPLSGTLFDDGLGSYSGTTSDNAAKAYDGDVNTYYDCANTSGGYTGIDLGTTSSVSHIVFAPRSGWESRMVGGVFEGSNTSATTGYVTLATVTQTPGDGLTNTFTVSDLTPYRWLRYRGPDNGNCNVAEVQFYH